MPAQYELQRQLNAIAIESHQRTQEFELEKGPMCAWSYEKREISGAHQKGSRKEGRASSAILRTGESSRLRGEGLARSAVAPSATPSD